MITFKHVGDLSKTKKSLLRSSEVVRRGILNKYGQAGVDALSSATPVDTGVTAASWTYKIFSSPEKSTIAFYNTNTADNKNKTNIAILLQYDHATGNGGWVQGIDYINPAIKPVFDNIVNEMWKEVTRK